MTYDRWKLTALGMALASGAATFASAPHFSEAAPVVPYAYPTSPSLIEADAWRAANGFLSTSAPTTRMLLDSEPLVEGLMVGNVAPLPSLDVPPAPAPAPVVTRSDDYFVPAGPPIVAQLVEFKPAKVKSRVPEQPVPYFVPSGPPIVAEVVNPKPAKPIALVPSEPKRGPSEVIEEVKSKEGVSPDSPMVIGMVNPFAIDGYLQQSEPTFDRSQLTSPAKPAKTLVAAKAVKTQLGKGEKVIKPLAIAVSAPPPPRIEDTRVTLDFVNTEIVQILKALALQSGTNVVTGPEVKGTLTVSLHDVTVDTAIKLVTSLAGIEYSQVGDTYIVASHERIGAVKRQITGEAPPPPEATVSVAYMVRGGKAVDLIAAVCGKDKFKYGLVDLTSTPAESSSSQAIVLHGPDGEVARLKEVFEQIDRQGSDSEQFEVMEVHYVNPAALREELIVAVPGLRASVAPSSAANPRSYTANKGITDASTVAGDVKRLGGGDSSGGGKEGAGGGGGGGGASSNDAKAKEDIRDLRNARGLSQPFSEFEPTGIPMRLVLRGTPEQIAKAKAFAAKVDLAPKQVALELRVMELNREEALRVGIDWSILSANGTIRTFRINNGLGDTPSTAGTINTVFSQGGSVTATLDAIANRQNLIARPNMLAIDGRESELFVGDVIRYIKSIQATQNGVTVIVDEERVGVKLAVFPRVGADGSITMDMRPVLSYLRGYTAVPGGGQLPQTSERVAQSTAVIKSGETLAIGGLIQDQDRRDVKGIPFLKDLPLFGSLFRRIEKSRDRTEVVFFLTAKVVGEEDRANAAEPKKDFEKPKK